MDQTTRRRIQQIRQRWRVVAAVTAVGVLAAGVFSLVAHPTYVGKSTLMLSGRTPDQDAVMVLGYLTIFNDPATIGWLKSTAKIPAEVTVEAQTVAASPILSVNATADDPKVAQNAAVAIAEAFGNYINAAREQGKQSSVAELERQLDGVSPFASDGSANPYYAALQQRIDDARGNSTNELMGLQPQAGVTENAPSVGYNLVTGALGGLLLGILAALGLAAISTRLANSADLRDKTGIAPLAEVPAGGSVKLDRLREDRLRALANTVSFEGLPKPAVITVTDSRGGRGGREIAEALAKLSAQQGSRTILVYADNDASEPAAGLGFNDALADSGTVRDVLKDGDVDSLKVLPAGSIVADRFSLASRERIVALFNELRASADAAIVAAPSIAETTDTQLLCAAADVTILVVPRRSKVGDVTSAADALTKAHALLLGAVLIDGTKPKHEKTKPKHENGRSAGTPRDSSNPWVECYDENESYAELALAESQLQAVGVPDSKPIA